MARDIEKEVRSNIKTRKIVLEWCKARKAEYHKSRCYTLLKQRYETLRDAVLMRSPVHEQNYFNSKIIVSLARQNYLLRRAITKKNFRQDPLITLDPIGATTIQNAEDMQQVLALNFLHTEFRQKCFDQMVDSASWFGSSVVFSLFQQKIQYGWTTAWDPTGMTQYPRVYAPISQQKNVWNHNVHILNYFQYPEISESESSKFRGFTDRMCLADLIRDVEEEPDMYIKEAIQKVIRDGKKAASIDSSYYADNAMNSEEFERMNMDVERIWTHLPIKGNEEDYMIYYVEIVGDEIIRINQNRLDRNICPLTTATFRRRREYWWGHSDTEDVLPEENYMTLLLTLKADQALKQLDQLFFYPQGLVSPDDINNRMSTQGYIPYDPTLIKDVRQVFYPWQSTDNSTYNTDFIMREIKELAQRKTPSPDFSRGYNQGGLNNKTATAALIMNENSDALESDMMETFGYDLTRVAKKNVILLQQYLGDEFQVRQDIYAAEQTLQKWMILGTFGYRVSHALQKSKVSEFTRFHNIITGIMNFIASGHPSWQNVNLDPLIRKYIKHADIDDVGDVYPPVSQMQMNMGMTQQNALPMQQQLQPAQMPQQTIQQGVAA